MKILAGMVAEEKLGVRGSVWMTMEGDSMTITNFRIHQSRVRDLKLQGHDVVYVDNNVSKLLLKSLTS